MDSKKIEWILRIGVFLEFLGHGVFGLMAKASWLGYFAPLGISETTARTLLPLIGGLDIIIALLVLIFPLRIVIGWATFWGFMTALIRPISGEPIWDFIERGANWAAPLALLFLKGIPKTFGDWFKK